MIYIIFVFFFFFLEDKKKDRRKGRREKDDGYEAITSDMVVEMLQESIRVIWKFIRADKDCHHNTNGSLKRPKKLQVELQDPADEQLLTHIQTDLQKVCFFFVFFLFVFSSSSSF